MKTKTIMNQIALAGACALPLASAGAGNSLEIKMKKKPNIILINCDDLGYGDLGCYGSQRNHTPTIDALAAEGTRFTDFYMPASVCSPSRAGMYTGCYPARIGFDTFDGLNAHNKPVLCPGDPTGLNPSEITFAEILKEQGYATKLVGKWHCGDQPEFLPTQHGFDSYFGLPFSNSDARSKWKPTGQPLPLMRDTDVIEQQPQQADLTARYVEECSQFIEANQNEPFLLCLAHMYVHTPLYVPDEFMKNSENGKYGGAVAAIDWALSVMLRQLKELGLEENTLILFTSDNGSYLQSPITDVTGGSNDPLRGWKGCTWEGGIRLPLIARWPGKIPAGRECSELITAMDFLPTFAALTAWHPGNALFEIPLPQPTIKGVVSICGAADRDYDKPHICPPSKEVADNASPKKWITKDSAPVLICHGSEDQVVPLEQAYRLKEACETNQLEHEFIIFDGKDHALMPELWDDLAIQFINQLNRKTS